VEDDLTVAELRRDDAKTRLDKPFMSGGELTYLRKTIMRVTQNRLCEQLISPSTGEPVSVSIMSLWEKSRRPIPLWVSRRVRDLAECVRRVDAKALEG
jgi:hypothetical protein